MLLLKSWDNMDPFWKIYDSLSRSHFYYRISFFWLFHGVPEFLDSGRKSWTPDSGRLTLTLDAGLWMLDSGRWTLDAGPWMLDPGRWTLDAGLWTLSAKTLKFKNIQRFGNNGSTPITSFLNSTSINIFDHFRYENFSMVYLFQVTLSNHPKISKTRGLQMMWSGKVDLKRINMIFCFC